MPKIGSVADRPRKQTFNRQHYCPSRASPVNCGRWLARVVLDIPLELVQHSGELLQEIVWHLPWILDMGDEMSIKLLGVGCHQQMRKVPLVKALRNYSRPFPPALPKLDLAVDAALLRAADFPRVLPFAGLERVVNDKDAGVMLEVNLVVEPVRCSFGIMTTHDLSHLAVKLLRIVLGVGI